MHPEKTEARGDQSAGNINARTTGDHYITLTPWLRKSAAAERASVSTSTIDKWRNEGLPYHLIGGTVLVHIDELDSFIREHRARVIARRHGFRGAR